MFDKAFVVFIDQLVLNLEVATHALSINMEARKTALAELNSAGSVYELEALLDRYPSERFSLSDSYLRHAVFIRSQAKQWAVLRSDVINFLIDRLKVQQKEAGVRHDLIDAVFALGGEDDLVRLLARVHALQAFVGTPDGINLLAGYKRAANILKKEGVETAEKIALSYAPEPEEAALIAALDAAEPRAAAAIAREDFEGAMAALAGLRAPIDAFFDKVTVNDPNKDKRAARLALLARMRDAVHQVADFTRIDG